MQQLKIFQQQLKPVQQKLQQLSEWFVKFKKNLEKRPQVERDRLLTLALVLILGFAGWYEYNDKADYFNSESFPAITPRTAEDIEVRFDIIPSEHKKIYSVAVAQDNTTIASSNEDGTLNLWVWDGVSSYKILGKFEEQKVQSVAFSSDGKMLASGNWDGTIQLWNWDSKKKTFNQVHQVGEPFKTNEKLVSSVAFSPDNKMLASGHLDGTIQLWNWNPEKKTLNKAGELLQPGADKTGEQSIRSVAFSPDSKILASSNYQGETQILNVKTRKIISILSNSKSTHKNSIFFLAFSPAPSQFFFDSNTQSQLVTGSYDGTIKLWKITSFGKLHGEPKTLGGYHDQLSSIALSKDGKILASGSKDGTIKLWSTLSGQSLRTLRSHPYRVSSLAFDGATKTLVSGSFDETVKVWRVRGKVKMGWKFPELIKLYPQ